MARALFAVAFLVFVSSGFLGMLAAVDALTLAERLAGFANGTVTLWLGMICLHDAVSE